MTKFNITMITGVGIFLILCILAGSYASNRNKAVYSYNEWKSKVADIENVHAQITKTIQSVVGVDKISRQDYDTQTIKNVSKKCSTLL